MAISSRNATRNWKFVSLIPSQYSLSKQEREGGQRWPKIVKAGVIHRPATASCLLFHLPDAGCE